jgi:hypothetical protein
VDVVIADDVDVVGVVRDEDDVGVVVGVVTDEDDVVVAGEGDVDVIVGNVSIIIVVLVMASGPFGGRMTNLNSRERVITKAAKIVAQIPTIIHPRRRCRHSHRSFFLVLFSGNIFLLLGIFYCTRSFNLKEKSMLVRNYLMFACQYQRKHKMQLLLFRTQKKALLCSYLLIINLTYTEGSASLRFIAKIYVVKRCSLNIILLTIHHKTW